METIIDKDYRNPLTFQASNARENVDNNNIKLTSYSDFNLNTIDENVVTYGTLTDANSPEASGGGGIMIISATSDKQLKDTQTKCEVTDLPRLKCSGRKTGEMHSYGTELMAIYIAFRLMEHNPVPKIQISKSVEGQFKAQMARSPKRALKLTKDSQFVL